MTILPKKKQSQGKSEGDGQDAGSHQQPSASDTSNVIYSGRNSPPRWATTAGHSTGPNYEEYEGGPSHSKRRARTNPHHTLRKHRTNVPSPTLSSNTGAAPSPGSPGTNPGTDSNPSVSSGTGEDCPVSGYNSGDEYGPQTQLASEEEWAEKERMFEKKLRKKGLIIKKMGEDGACLFRAVADQVYGDEEMHIVVRKHCMDYMAKNADYYKQYITEDFETYISRKRQDHTHGNHIEMQALTEIYSRTVEVYHYGTDPINIFHGTQKSDNEPIRLSYHKNVHYNSIVDPHKATVGVGLGLPGHVPGQAEKNLVRDAVRQSEDFHIEQTMLEDKIKATDWEATNETIEEQVARESYLQWLRDNEKRARKQAVRSATATSSSTVTSAGGRSPRSRGSASNSPIHPGANMDVDSTSVQPEAVEGAEGAVGGLRTDQILGIPETASFINCLSPRLFGLDEWEDADILARVLAASQHEYLQSLKRDRSQPDDSSKPGPSGNR